MRISDWSSDVCSSDLLHQVRGRAVHLARVADQAELRIPALARLDHLDERGGRGDVRPFERAGDDPRLGIVGQDAAVPYPEQAVQPLDHVRPGGTGAAEAIDLLRLLGIAAGGTDRDQSLISDIDRIGGWEELHTRKSTRR